MIKLVKQWALVAFVAVFAVSCSSDDNERIDVPNKDQKEIGKQLDFKGEFDYHHAGNNIPFIFDSETITVAMGGMMGSGQEDEIYDVLRVYENTKTNVRKVVTKSKDSGLFKAFFYKNKTEDALELNLDKTYEFSTEDAAIKTAYPTSEVVRPDHENGNFGWLKLTKHDASIKLPISGAYRLDVKIPGMSMYYQYTFSNELVGFDGTHAAQPYDMEVLAYNESTNKILLKGVQQEVSNTYYVMQLKNITDTTADIARQTLATKEEAEALFASFDDIAEAKGFSTYVKQGLADLAKLSGIYQSAKIEAANSAQYEFHIGTGNDAFVFMADMTGDGTLVPSAKLTLDKKSENNATGQIVYLITEATGYYSTRKGQFLTIYAKDINNDGSKATLSIATNKEDAFSISNSAGDVIGKTLEEAQAIAAPKADAVWKNDMMAYAGLWIPTTRK